MFDKLNAEENRYEELNMRLSDPAVIQDQNIYRKLMKEHADLTPLVEKYREYKKLDAELSDTAAMLDDNRDPDFEGLLKAEIATLKEKIEAATEELKVMLVPRDPNDDRSVIIEIRGGAGGEEAALFAAALFRMYSMYAERRGWKTEIVDINETELGGFKEIVFTIEARGAYSRFKFESGVHRVQRVPDTEASGRIHTSTVTVAVLPELDDVEVNINPADLAIDTYRSGGAGGQHINKTESAIRITHIPTGIVVTCQDERSQHKNRDKAMKVLAAKLYEAAQEAQHSEITQSRRSQVGTGDRSERIRTYNFPQGRVTDHRIGLSLYRIDDIMNGDIDEIIDKLSTSDRTKAVSEGDQDD